MENRYNRDNRREVVKDGAFVRCSLSLCSATDRIINGWYEGRTESHEQLFFLRANWEQQTKKSAVVDGTSCCVILECLVTSIACIT